MQMISDSFLNELISVVPFLSVRVGVFFIVWVRLYLLLTVWPFLMASLSEMVFNTFLINLCAGGFFYVQITFTSKIIDLFYFHFQVLVVMAKIREFYLICQIKWNSSQSHRITE